MLAWPISVAIACPLTLDGGDRPGASAPSARSTGLCVLCDVVGAAEARMLLEIAGACFERGSCNRLAACYDLSGHHAASNHSHRHMSGSPNRGWGQGSVGAAQAWRQSQPSSIPIIEQLNASSIEIGQGREVACIARGNLPYSPVHHDSCAPHTGDSIAQQALWPYGYDVREAARQNANISSLLRVRLRLCFGPMMAFGFRRSAGDTSMP